MKCPFKYWTLTAECVVQWEGDSCTCGLVLNPLPGGAVTSCHFSSRHHRCVFCRANSSAHLRASVMSLLLPVPLATTAVPPALPPRWQHTASAQSEAGREFASWGREEQSQWEALNKTRHLVVPDMGVMHPSLKRTQRKKMYPTGEVRLPLEPDRHREPSQNASGERAASRNWEERGRSPGSPSSSQPGTSGQVWIQVEVTVMSSVTFLLWFLHLLWIYIFFWITTTDIHYRATNQHSAAWEAELQEHQVLTDRESVSNESTSRTFLPFFSSRAWALPAAWAKHDGKTLRSA